MIYLKCFLFFLDPPTLDPLFAVFTSVLTETTVSTPTHTQNWEIMDEPSASRLFFLLSSVRSDERLVSSLSDGRLIYREIYPITLSISLSYPSIPPSFIQPPLAEGLSWKKEKKTFSFSFLFITTIRFRCGGGAARGERKRERKISID